MALSSNMPTASLFSLTGKTAIVTGGTGGIGLSVVPSLAELGADIISIQVPDDPQTPTLKSAIEQHGRTLTVFHCNLKDAAAIRATFARIWEAGITPDILLHMAGVTHSSKVVATPIDVMDNVIDINVRAAYLVSQEFGRQLLALKRPGKIIHIASMAATLAQEDICVYAASKAFVRQMVRGLSNEWAREGIRVNCVSPGFVKTPMSKHLHNDEAFSEYVKGRTSVGRWSEPGDLKGVIVFLASEASEFVTGEEIVVDGGVIGR